MSPLGYGTGYTHLPFYAASSIIISLLHGMSQRCLMRSWPASQASLRIWKRSMTRLALRNAVRTILRMESDKSSVTSSTALRCSSSIVAGQRLRPPLLPATTAAKLLPRADLTVGYKRVAAHHWMARIRRWRTKPIFSRTAAIYLHVQLLPLPETAQHFLVCFSNVCPSM